MQIVYGSTEYSKQLNFAISDSDIITLDINQTLLIKQEQYMM